MIRQPFSIQRFNPIAPVVRFVARQLGQRRAQVVAYLGTLRGFRTRWQRNLSVYWDYFETNEIVHAATMESVRARAAIPFMVERWRDGRWEREPEPNQIVERLANPNATHDEVSFREAMELELDVTGNAIVVELASRRRDQLGELRLLPTANVFVEVDDVGLITAYIYDPEKKATRGPRQTTLNQPSKKAVRYGAEQVLHRRYVPDPDDSQWGLSPYAAAVESIEADYAIGSYITNFFQRGAVPPYMLVVDSTLSKEQRDQLRSEWEQTMGGVDNAWKLAVIDGSRATLQRLGLAAGSREIGLYDLRNSVEARILMVLNVPPVVVGAVLGVTSTTSYASYEQARQAFHEENTDPAIRKRDAAFTHFIRHRLSLSGIRVRGDMADVLAVQQRLNERSQQTTRELQSGVVSINEARQKLSLPPIAAGDVILVPLYLQAVPSASADVPSPISESRVRALARDLHDHDKTADHVQALVNEIAQQYGKSVLALDIEALMTELPRRQDDESRAGYARRILLLAHATATRALGTVAGGLDNATGGD